MAADCEFETFAMLKLRFPLYLGIPTGSFKEIKVESYYNMLIA